MEIYKFEIGSLLNIIFALAAIGMLVVTGFVIKYVVPQIKNELKKPTSFFDSVFENDKMKSKNETKKKKENDFKIENEIDVDEILKSVYAPLEVEDIIIEGLGEG